MLDHITERLGDLERILDSARHRPTFRHVRLILVRHDPAELARILHTSADEVHVGSEEHVALVLVVGDEVCDLGVGADEVAIEESAVDGVAGGLWCVSVSEDNLAGLGFDTCARRQRGKSVSAPLHRRIQGKEGSPSAPITQSAVCFSPLTITEAPVADSS